LQALYDKIRPLAEAAIRDLESGNPDLGAFYNAEEDFASEDEVVIAADKKEPVPGEFKVVYKTRRKAP